MTPAELEDLHRICFSDAPRPWNASEFQSLLEDENTYCVEVPQGFAIGRVAGPEVELLTLAVHPDSRKQGHGTALISLFENEAALRGADEVFLEVSSENTAAYRLYVRSGYSKVGLRPRYYTRGDKLPADALVMKRYL